MRTLGIDYGTRRIGLALSDEGGTFVTPLEVLDVSSPDLAVPPILNLIKKEDVKRIVIGLPLNMDGSVGPSAQTVVAWAKSWVGQTTAELAFVDERLSSFEAEQQLIDRKRAGQKMTRKDKKQRLDAIAAANLLQAFLDGRLPEIHVTK